MQATKQEPVPVYVKTCLILSSNNRKTLQVVDMATASNNKTSIAKRKADAKSLYYLQFKEKHEVAITNVDLRSNNLHWGTLLTWL